MVNNLNCTIYKPIYVYLANFLASIWDNRAVDKNKDDNIHKSEALIYEGKTSDQ